MYSVTKEIRFCYGHRLLGHPGTCRHLHGHNARAIIRLESQTLDSLGLVVDFKDIGDYVKSWIDGEIDHTLLLFQDDPLLPLLRAAGERVYEMDANPSAENIARLIYEHARDAGLPISSRGRHSAMAGSRRAGYGAQAR